MMNSLKNKAERSTSHLRDVHEEKIDAISMTLSEVGRHCRVWNK